MTFKAKHSMKLVLCLFMISSCLSLQDHIYNDKVDPVNSSKIVGELYPIHQDQSVGDHPIQQDQSVGDYPIEHVDEKYPSGGVTSQYAHNCYTGYIYLSVDNVLTDLRINGYSIKYKIVGDLNDWTKTKYAKTNLKSGDTISISGYNQYPYNPLTNPGAMIASIPYYDRYHHLKYVNTNKKWRCKIPHYFASAAKELGANSSTTSPWYNAIHMPLANIRPNAQWIWYKKLSTTAVVTCFYQLP